MCIAAWIWQAHPLYPLVLLHNRDELHDRPAKAVGWWDWDSSRKILAGRDMQAGGTWMGCTKDGRIAFLTNVLEPSSQIVPFSKSRGDLPVQFLQSKMTPLEFAEQVIKQEDWYNGFNLVIADICTKQMVYVSNRPKQNHSPSIQIITSGLHVLTNAARLDTPWDKGLRLRRNFKELLREHGEDKLPVKSMVESLMCDKVKTSKDRLPKTGYNDSDWEYQLSSIFNETQTELGLYGTRSQISLSVTLDGHVSLYERYLEDNIWNEHTVEYFIKQ